MREFVIQVRLHALSQDKFLPGFRARVESCVLVIIFVFRRRMDGFLRLCRFGVALASLEELEDPLESLSLLELSSSKRAVDELEVDL